MSKMELPFDDLSAQADVNMVGVRDAIASVHVDAKFKVIHDSSHPRHVKIVRLLKLVGELSDAITPLVACKDGCNHCCKQAVAVNLGEARVISQRYGIPYTTPSADALTVENLKEVQGKYTNVACPFLKDDRCAVYEFRPFACRMHFNVSNVSEACDLDKYPEQTVPGLIMGELYPMIWHVSGTAYADIRDWFPPTKE